MLKPVVLIFCVTLVVQSYGGSIGRSELPVRKPRLNGYTLELEALVEKAAQEAFAKIEGYITDVETLVNDAYSVTKALADRSGRRHLVDLMLIKRTAQDAKLDISECMREPEDIIKNAPSIFLAQATKCGTDLVADVKATLRRDWDLVRQAVRDAAQLALDANNCFVWLVFAPFCVIYRTIETGMAVVDVPLSIAAVAADAAKLVIETETALPQCTKQVIENMECATSTIIRNVGKCVSRKWHEKHPRRASLN